MADVPFASVALLPTDPAERQRRIEELLQQLANSLPKNLGPKTPPQFLVERTDQLFIRAGFTPEEATAGLNFVFGTPDTAIERYQYPRGLTTREQSELSALPTGGPVISIGDFTPRPEGLPLVPISGG